MVKREKCCGCTACFSICSHKCISMEKDALGFYYPNVNMDKCVRCGLCEKVCPVINKEDVKNDNPMTWGGYVSDESLRLASSSGGLFSLFALKTIEKGGVVFGAALANKYREVRHIMVEDADSLASLRGSKYVQSNVGDSYVQAKQQLDAGRDVLFSGTPCQIDGLKLFLQKEYDRLFTIEVICHGTPSPKLFKKYINYMEEKMDGMVKSVSFRDEIGGENLIMRIETSAGKVYREDKFTDSFYRLFLSNICLRESCYDCPSRGLNRRADITLSDFWGVENMYPDLMDGGGISLVIMHTKKGEDVFCSISDEVKGHEVSFKEAIKGNCAFFESYDRPVKREQFLEDIDNLSIKKLDWKYASRKEKLKCILRKCHLIKIICY